MHWVDSKKILADRHADCDGISPMIADPVSILQTAAALAARAHADQFIRNSETPYIAHPIAVSMAITCLFGCSDPEIAAAALLHDTLEKTQLTAGEINDTLGSRVLGLVTALTKEEGDRKRFWETLAGGPWEARIIKMADALDHLNCPPEELARRIKNGRRAASLGFSEEEPIRCAVRILEEAIVLAAIRLGNLE